MVFLLPFLSTLKGKVNISPTYKDGDFLNIKIGYQVDNQSYVINIKDSYLLLKSKLSSLAKQFNLDDKGIFPYTFPNQSNLNYIGKVPLH